MPTESERITRLHRVADGSIGPRARKLVTGGDPVATARIPDALAFVDGAGRIVESLPAPELDAIVAALIADREDLTHLGQLLVIATARKAEGGASDGRPIFAGVEVVKWQAKHFARQLEDGGSVQVLLWVGADHARAYQISAYRLEREIYQQLTRIQRSARGKVSIGPPGVTVNLRAMARYDIDPLSDEASVVRLARQLSLEEA